MLAQGPLVPKALGHKHASVWKQWHGGAIHHGSQLQNDLKIIRFPAGKGPLLLLFSTSFFFFFTSVC